MIARVPSELAALQVRTEALRAALDRLELQTIKLAARVK